MSTILPVALAYPFVILADLRLELVHLSTRWNSSLKHYNIAYLDIPTLRPAPTPIRLFASHHKDLISSEKEVDGLG